MKLTTTEGHVVEGTPAEIADFLRIREDAKKDRPKRETTPADVQKALADYMRELDEMTRRWPQQPVLPWYQPPGYPPRVVPMTPNGCPGRWDTITDSKLSTAPDTNILKAPCTAQASTGATPAKDIRAQAPSIHGDGHAPL